MIEENINTEVLQNYARDFADVVISNLGDETVVIRGKDILNLTPSKQVNFFILKLLYSKWQDEIKRLESPYFNYKNEEVRKALSTFMNVLSQHIEVNQKDIKPLLFNAVELTIRWTISPSRQLKAEITERDVKTVESIKNLVRYYKIYQEDLSYLIKEKEESDISQFLEEWDQLMEQKSRASTIDKELGLLSQVIPITLNDLLDIEDEEIEPVIEDQAEEIEDVAELAPESEDQPPVEEVDNEIEDSDKEVAPIGEEVLEEEVLEEDADETEIINDESGEPESLIQKESEDEEKEPDDSINKQFARSQETLHDQYKEEQVSVAAKHQQKKISSILEAVSVNQEYMFTTELFGGEKYKFHEAVEKIEGCNSFDESVELLVSDYSKDYSWNMNSLEVKELLKVVFRRFR